MNVLLTQQGTFWEMLALQAYDPAGWSVNTSVDLDQDKLAQGIIKGNGGAVSISQMFSTSIASGTHLVVKVTRADTNESGTVHVQTLRANGSPYGGNKNITYADGFVEFETTETTYGLRLSTAHGTREVSSISLFQGDISGGTVQANGNGGLLRISGTAGYNAGASSSQYIEGNSDGYVQFQWGAEFKSQRVGLTYQDVDYQNIYPFELTINGSGFIFTNGTNNFSQNNFAVVGDFFRIRHYASDNSVRFQKRQDIYGTTTLDYASLQANSGDNHIFTEANRPYIRGLNDEGGFVEGQIYRMYEVNTVSSQLRGRIYTTDGTDLGFSNAGTKWEVVNYFGADYVTFHTHSDTTNGNHLYVDTSLFHIGSQLNDVLIAR